MSPQEYSINNRAYTHLLPLKEEFVFEKDKNYLFELDYLSCLSVLGDKAEEFLQGQLSCDLRQVTTETIRRGAMCNLKGRVLALLDVLNWQGFQLILPKDILTETQVSLTKTAMLSRVKLEQLNGFEIYGFYLSNQDDLLPTVLQLPSEQLSLSANENNCIYHLGGNFYILIIKKEQAPDLQQRFSKHGQMRGSLAWHQLRLKSKEISIYPETRGLFLPHRIDLQLAGYLSFDKGCYKGQEIVARTHYRAKLKHGLKLFVIKTTDTLFAGKKLFNLQGDVEVGELIDFSPLDERYLIAVSILLDCPSVIRIEGIDEPVSLGEK